VAILVLLILSVIIVGALSQRGEDRTWLSRARAIPAATLAALHPGVLARFTGTVSPAAPHLVSPLGKRPCVYWSLRVFTQVQPPGRRSQSTLIAEETAHSPFVLDDGTACAEVDARESVVITYGWRAEDTGLRTSKEHAALLARLGLDPRAGFFRTRYSFEERIVAVGARVAVIGAGRHGAFARAQAGSYREPASSLVRIDRSVNADLRVIAHPDLVGYDDGKISSASPRAR
jgi:hypothetical protein